MINLFLEYTENSTIAGLHYAFKPKQLLVVRLLWMAAIAILTFLGIWFSVQSYLDWNNKPVLTTITNTGQIFQTFR
jgi:hypothetical protein